MSYIYKYKTRFKYLKKLYDSEMFIKYDHPINIIFGNGFQVKLWNYAKYKSFPC